MNDVNKMKGHKNELVADIENSFQEMNTKLDKHTIEIDRMFKSHSENISASFDSHHELIEQKLSEQRKNVSKMMRKFSWQTTAWLVGIFVMWSFIFYNVGV